MELTEHRCHRCGGELTQQSDTRWKCPYCGSAYDDATAVKNTADLHEMFDEAKRELINNARRNLYDATVAKYISSEDVKDACREIKKYLPDDFRASFYEIAADTNIKRTVKAIRKVDADRYFDEVENIINFIIKDLQPDYLLELNNLIERAYKKRGDLQTFERLATEISIQAEKVQQGVYETMLHRDVFVAYSSKDIDKVSELVELLEENNLKCFVAARNLRHGRGAVENYNKALEEAMDNCDVFVFISTPNSRSLGCDALTIEMKHIMEQDRNNAPGELRSKSYAKIPQEYKKPRVHYYAEPSKKRSAADDYVDEFFDGHEWAYSSAEVLDRVVRQLLDTPSVPPASDENDSIAKQKELEERRAREEAQRRAAKAEADRIALQKANQKTAYSPETQATAKNQTQNPYSSSYTPPTPKPGTPKKKSHGCLISFLVIAGLIALFIVIMLIEDLAVTENNDPPTSDAPSYEEYITSNPSDQVFFPITGEYNGIQYSLDADGVLTLSGNGGISGSLYADLYFSATDGYNYFDEYAGGFVTKLVISEGITAIGDSTFSNMQRLTEVVLPESVTSIGYGAFANCHSLRAINLSSVQKIGLEAFRECDSLVEADLSSLISIANYAFYSCDALSSITVGSSLAEIPSDVFNDTAFYYSLTESSPLYLGSWLYRVHPNTSGRFEIPDFITHIAYDAFCDCQNIEEIFIPASVKHIGDRAFFNTYNVKNIIYAGDRDSWESVEKGESFDSGTGEWAEGYTYTMWYLGEGNDPDDTDDYTSGLKFKLSEDGSYVSVTGYSGSETTVIIPAAYFGVPVTSIAREAFRDSSVLSIYLPKTITYIGDRAFYSSALQSVSIADGCKLTYVGAYAFTSSSLWDLGETIYIGNALISISPSQTFDTFTVAEGTTYIATEAFSDRGALYAIYIPKSVTSIGDRAFKNAYNVHSIIYEGSQDDWNNIQKGESFDSGCGGYTTDGYSLWCINGTYDPDTAETYTSGLKFTLDDTGTYVAVTGYNGSSYTVTVPSTYYGFPVKEIRSNAFSSSSISSISLPASIEIIEREAFFNAGSLTEVTVADGSKLRSIGINAFNGTSIYASVTLDAPFIIGSCLIKAASYVTGTYEIPSGVKYIAPYAFHSASFTSVLIPEGLEFIDTYAFDSAYYVEELIYLGTEEQWNGITKITDWDSSCGISSEAGSYTVIYLNGEYDTTVTDPYTVGLRFKFDSASNSYAVSGYTGTDTDIVIPSKYLGFPVTAVGTNAFYEKNITSVSIPDSVVTIGSSAFESTALSSISIPASVVTIGSSAFESTALSSISIPASVESIGSYVFKYCSSLTSVEFAQDTKLKNIPQGMFYACDISTFDIPNSIERIEQEAFYSNESLKQIVTASECNLAYIGAYAFYECSSLEKLIIAPNGKFNNIDIHAFGNCAALEEISIPASMDTNSISIYDFEGSENIKIMTVPAEMVNYISRSNVVKLTINGGSSISDYAMSECQALETVIIETDITSIGSNAFYNCVSLKSINLPETLETIGDHAFDNCDSLTDITIPNSITVIRSYVFESCNSLANVTLPSGVKEIMEGAFSGCSSLSTVTLPETLETIGASAFSGTALTSITVPSAVSKIEDHAFADLTSLESITFNGTVENVGSSAFSGTVITDVTMPADMIDKINRLSLIEVTLTDGDLSSGAFSGCTNLRKITLHDGIEMIGDSAFANCSSLLSIELPASITAIRSNAFTYCDSLAEIINHTALDTASFTPDNVLIVHNGESKIEYSGDFAFITIDSESYLLKYIGNETELTLPDDHNGSKYIVRMNAFKQNSSIASLTVNGAYRIEQDAFYNCSALEALVLGDDVLYIGSSAFSACRNLKSITFGSGLEEIAYNAFGTCTSLKKLELPQSLKKIGGYAFQECSTLSVVKIPSSVVEIGAHAFKGCSNLGSVSLPEGTVFGIYSGASETPFETYTASANGATNAEALMNTYYNYTWKKQESAE